MPNYTLDWTNAGSNGTYTTASGSHTAGFDVTTNTSTSGQTASVRSGGSPSQEALWVSSLTEPVTTTISFDDPVQDLSFEIFDIDSAAGWDDKLTIIALDADGNQVTINFSDLDGLHSVAGGNELNADGSFNSGVETTGAEDSVTVSIPGPIVSLQFIFDNGESVANSGMFGVSDISFASAPDFTISGTAGDDTIDFGYLGDSEGDRVDNNDAADGSNDDIIEAGAGNDTVYAGLGDDSVHGHSGDDTIFGGSGNDTLTGGIGNDTIDGGTGDDSLYGQDGNDVLDGGDGQDSLYGGTGDDSLSGGIGNDTLSGGAGSDTMSGGDDRDTFTNITIGDDIDGNEGGDDNDTLDLTGAAPAGGSITIVFDAANPENGTVNFFDASNTLLGQATFQNIENIVGAPAPITTSIYDAIEYNGTLASSGDSLSIGAGELVEIDEPITVTQSAPGLISIGDTALIDGNVFTITAIESMNDTLDFQVDDGTGPTTVTHDAILIHLSDGTTTLDYIIPHDGADLENISSVTATAAPTSATVVADGRLDTDESVSLAAAPPTLDYTVSGTAGDDVIDLGYLGDPDGDQVDNNDAADGSNDDLIEAGAGNDYAYGGLGNDTIYGGDGNDSLFGNDGDDTIYGGAGVDTVEAGHGNDTFFGGAGDDRVNGDYGDDVLHGGSGDDFLRGSFGNDTLYSGNNEGDDYMWGGYNDDTFIIQNNFGNDTIDAEEEAEVDGDTLDLSAVTDDLRIDLSNPTEGNGSFTDGVSTATYIDIENIILSAGTDTLVLSDESGSDVVESFDAPIDNGDGTYTGNDQLDVTTLTRDAGTTPVTTNDVVVTDDGNGNAVLTFPGGENLTLIGVTPAELSTPASLEAIGIPGPSDGIVSGTAGDDFIFTGYTGDNDGDYIDNNDAHLPGEVGDDDIVQAGDGNDTVYASDGNDEAHGEAGNDTLFGGLGHDTLTGGIGEDELHGDAGNDNLDGGDGNDILDGGAGSDKLEGGDGNDDLQGGTGEDTLVGGTGNDNLSGGDGRDAVYGGAGDDTLYSGVGSDTLEGGEGDDTIVLDVVNWAEAYVPGSIEQIDGGEGGETAGDTLDASGLNYDLVVDMDGHIPGDGESGSLTNGGLEANFENIENILLGDGFDAVRNATGGVTIHGGGSRDIFYNSNSGGNTFIGGDDGDIFQNISVGDVLDGSEGGDDNDTLNLITSVPAGGHIEVNFDPSNPENGTVEFFDASGASLGTASFANMENITGLPLDYTVSGTDGNDVINASYHGDTDGDLIDNNDAADGSNDDLVEAGDGDDSISSGLGDDTVYGGAGNDGVSGGAGNDILYGEDGDDELAGGAGDDTLTGGAGEDVLSGGDDQDLFLGATAGDSVDGGEGGNDNDTLDLTGAGPLRVVYDATNAENGTVEFLDGVGAVTSTMTFQNIENVVPCFTPGTMITTPTGERPVESLRQGDRVITRDNGIQKIRWVGSKTLDRRALFADPKLRPIMLRKGALGHDLPERDMLLSPNHRVLVRNEKTNLYLDEQEVLASAKHLINNRTINRVYIPVVTYIHFMFEQHEVVLSNGSWSESFQPGDYALAGVGAEQRSEIFDLFPGLKESEGHKTFQSARRVLKEYETRLVMP